MSILRDLDPKLNKSCQNKNGLTLNLKYHEGNRSNFNREMICSRHALMCSYVSDLSYKNMALTAISSRAFSCKRVLSYL